MHAKCTFQIIRREYLYHEYVVELVGNGDMGCIGVQPPLPLSL